MVYLHIHISSFRMRRLGRTLCATQGTWRQMCLYWFNRLGGMKLLLNSNFDTWNINQLL